MSELPDCPDCNSAFTYEDAGMLVCPECGHEWKTGGGGPENSRLVVKDANSNILVDGDSVSVIKDLKVKGTSLVVKLGTRVKNIRLVDGDHNIDCKITGIGP